MFNIVVAHCQEVPASPLQRIALGIDRSRRWRYRRSVSCSEPLAATEAKCRGLATWGSAKMGEFALLGLLAIGALILGPIAFFIALSANSRARRLEASIYRLAERLDDLAEAQDRHPFAAEEVPSPFTAEAEPSATRRT